MEYSQAIDASTVLAILSDFDLADPAQLAAARQTLDILKESAPEEEQSGFDASAASAPFAPVEGRRDDEGSVSTKSAAGWTTTEGTDATGETGVSHDLLSDLEGLVLHSPGSSGSGTGSVDESRSVSGRDTPVTPEGFSSGLDALDNESKEKVLMGIFPQLKPFDITWTLRKCKYDAGVAIDELMTQSFLEESGGRHKGVEAFTDGTDAKPKRKGKGKKKGGKGRENRLSKEDGDGEQASEDNAPSQWERGRHDVEFLSQKTGIPMQQIGSLYHANGANVKTTIKAIVKGHQDVGLEDDDDAVVQLHAYQMKADFPTLSTADLTTLLQLTQPSFSDAHALAEALCAQEPTSKKGGIKIEFKHAPPDLTSESTTPHATSSKALYNLDHSTASSSAQSLHLARAQASTQAASAYRKSRSSPLYGGVASYYSQVSRDLSDRAKSMESAAADALVASQSSRTQMDLHGVNVKDAVRISREGVTEWWVRECEERARLGRQGIGGDRGGFRIVTGVGRHSEGGKGKLGPAVGAMLIREGWRVEVGGGVIVVRGVAKK